MGIVGLVAERWRDLHEADLPVQTEPNADGRAQPERKPIHVPA